MKINVSFKAKEADLFWHIKEQRSPSTYIKDAVEFYRRHKNAQLVVTKEESQEPTEKRDQGSQVKSADIKGIMSF